MFVGAIVLGIIIVLLAAGMVYVRYFYKGQGEINANKET